MLLKLGQKFSNIHDKLRFYKDKKFIPLVNILPKWLTPNQITIFRTVLLLIWLPFAIFHPNLLQIIVFIVIYFLDLLDGALARIRNKVSYFGGCLDHISDKFNNIALFAVLYGITGYQFKIFEFFIWWDIATSILLAIEYFSKNKKISYARVPIEFVVKTILWIFLIFEVVPAIMFILWKH